VKAIWNGAVLAQSDETIVVEGNHYFPPDALNREYFQESSKHTTCGWKGQASYYDVVVNGDTSPSPRRRRSRGTLPFGEASR